MSQPDLLPCPFCSSTDIHDSSFGDQEYYFCCPSCGTDGPVGGDLDEAAEKWNVRARDARLAELRDLIAAYDSLGKQSGFVAATHDHERALGKIVRAARALVAEPAPVMADPLPVAPASMEQIGYVARNTLLRLELGLLGAVVSTEASQCKIPVFIPAEHSVKRERPL